MDLSFHFQYEGGKMQKSYGAQQDPVAAVLDSIGAEPLAGSGFETEKPDQDFLATEQAAGE
jgi:hypothetical protein